MSGIVHFQQLLADAHSRFAGFIARSEQAGSLTAEEIARLHNVQDLNCRNMADWKDDVLANRDHGDR